MTEKRRSLTGTASVSGVGIHTGAATTATLRPAPSGSGVVFRRVDLPGEPSIPASVDNVHEVDRRTSLGNDEIAIHTVEHVLAAVMAQRIDDLIIDVDGPELPSLDGSAEPFFQALSAAGPRLPANGRLRLARLPAHHRRPRATRGDRSEPRPSRCFVS